MPFADVNGQRLYFEDSGGDGPPVVLSHGFLMDHEMFAPQVAALSGEFRVITYDERGWGQTASTGPFTYWDLADDCAGLLDHLGIDRAVLGGMSQGGFLSLRAALSHPGRVKALVLIDTAAHAFDGETVAGYRALYEQMLGGGWGDQMAGAIAGMLFNPDFDNTVWRGKWRARPPALVEQAIECLVGVDDVTGRLGEITCPALVIHGELDVAFPMEVAEGLCDALPGCEGLVRVPGAGHSSTLERPDVVNGPLREFLGQYA